MAFLVLEFPENVKVMKKQCFEIVALSVKNFNYLQGTKVSILQCLKYFEHLAEPMAELLQYISTEYDFPAIVDQVLQPIAKEPSTKAICTFMVKSSELFPKEVLKNISCFVNLLDNDPYSQRCCFLEMLKNLISTYLVNEKSDIAKNQLKSFFRIFEARFYDVNSFVRSKNIMLLEDLFR